METSLPKRRLIPKWRQVKYSLATHEAAPISVQVTPKSKKFTHDAHAREVNFHEFEKAVSLWKEFKEPGVLGDIISFSLNPDLLELVVDIGRQAIKSGDKITLSQQFMIQNLLKSNEEEDFISAKEPESYEENNFQPFAQPIKELRALLRTDPANPLALLDFAQLQAAIGRNSVAERSLLSALGMSPNNRLVLRTLARFYVHSGESDRAYRLLRLHNRTPNDPWLVSSEIALADLVGKPSLFLAKGRRMLVDAGKFPSANFTELAGSIAMQELGAGNLKKARDFQRIALLDPTDNVVAQAVDREKQFGIALTSPNVERAIAHSAEAKMLQSWLNVMPDDVEKHALQWHNEEPFSSRPIQMLTAIFAFKGENQRAFNWLRVGLNSDAEDVGLLSNLAYVQARAGFSHQAKNTLLKARRFSGKEEEPYLLATDGSIAYSNGLFDLGDKLYKQALDLFKTSDKNRQNISTYCLLNQSIIAIERSHPRVDQIVSETKEALKVRPNPDAAMLLKIITPSTTPPTLEVSSSSKVQNDVKQRLTSQWVFDPKSNTLTERRGLTAVGAKAIVLQKDFGKKEK